MAAIPAFNEEKTIAKAVVRAMKHVDKVVVVDDGSTDDTALIAERLGAYVVSHEENRGYGAAIRSCFSVARDLSADVLVTLDADGQHDPEEIPKMIEPILNGESDIVVGSRFHEGSRKEIPAYRLAGMRMLNNATERIAKQKITDSQSGFRGYSRKAIDSIRLYETGMGVSSEILIKAGDAGLRISEVPIAVKYRGVGRPSQNPLSHGLEVLSSIVQIGAEKHPFLFVGLPGLLSAIGGIYGWFWVVERYAVVRQLAVGMALISTVLLVVGVVAVNTALILYAFSNLSKRL